jgi:branched-chain amino acid transport system permease protein
VASRWPPRVLLQDPSNRSTSACVRYSGQHLRYENLPIKQIASIAAASSTASALSVARPLPLLFLRRNQVIALEFALRTLDRSSVELPETRGTKLATFLQLTLNGLAVGCIYGLVALGFVLIYKATELVNFAQGDFLMLGAFVAYMAIVWWGLDYWISFLIAALAVAAFGALLDMTVLRRVIGQPQFAVVMLTIGLGAMFRTFASVTWGSEIYTLPTPFSGVTQVAGVTLSHQYLSIIVATVILCGVLYAFFRYTRMGVAMQATSQNQLAAYCMGIPVKLIFSLVWAISAAVATAAGILLAPVTLIDINMGLAVALKAFAAAVVGGFGSIPGALIGGITIGLIELYAGATLPEGIKNTAPYIVLLVMLAVRPQGLFGAPGRKRV